MKKSNFIVKSLLVLSLLAVSCSEDDAAPVVINNNEGNGFELPEGTQAIGGVLTEDLTLLNGVDYLLTEALIVPENIILTLNPGTKIEALVSDDIFIAIQQGGTINANGTAQNPIILTSSRSNPQSGDWGGLILLGRAPINSVVNLNTQTSTSEIGNLPYGGNIVNDNSGVLRYVRVEYSGGSASGSSENNGFSFYGVGNGTTVEFIEAFEGADDGVEFFGGTVNASNVVVINCEDDSVDWTEGYTGTLTDVYISHGATHDKGIEADGFNSDLGNLSSPAFFSNPTLNNITINGSDDTDDEAIRLRVGTRVTINNIVLNNFQEGFDLDDDETGVGVVTDETNIDGVLFNNVTLNVKNDTGATFTDADLISNEGTATGTDFATWGTDWTIE